MNHVDHRSVRSVAGVHPISRLIAWIKPIGLGRISKRLVEIEHPVKRVAGANPPVYGLANGVSARGVKRRSAIWRERTAEDFDPALVGSAGNLLQSLDDIAGFHPLACEGAFSSGTRKLLAST
jgi:hypothetical protein